MTLQEQYQEAVNEYETRASVEVDPVKRAELAIMAKAYRRLAIQAAVMDVDYKPLPAGPGLVPEHLDGEHRSQRFPQSSLSRRGL